MREKGEEEPLTGGNAFIAKRQLRAFRARSGSVLPFQYFWLCHRKWLMLFSLKFQKNNRRNAQPWIPSMKKLKKVYIFHYIIEMKQTQALTEPYQPLSRKHSHGTGTGFHLPSIPSGGKAISLPL